jgi:hypothetical protein
MRLSLSKYDSFDRSRVLPFLPARTVIILLLLSHLNVLKRPSALCYQAVSQFQLSNFRGIKALNISAVCHWISHT